MTTILISRPLAQLRGVKLRNQSAQGRAPQKSADTSRSHTPQKILAVKRPTASVFRAMPVTTGIDPNTRALSHAARAQEFLQHGRLAADHPAVTLARSSLARLKNLPRTYTVDVTAHALDYDAHIYPDGGIVISLKLLEFVKTEEALCGLLRHEIQHDLSGDFNRAKIKADDDTFASRTVKKLKEQSRSRIGEVRADLEGSIKALATTDEINPTGYIELLEDFATKERLRKQDLRGGTHGQSGDRALAARFLTHLVDLPALNQALTPIAGKESWRKNLPSNPFELFGAVSMLTKNARDPRAAAKELQVRRLQYFDGLSAAERLSFLNLLSERWTPALNDAKANEYPHAKLFWDNCLKRCEADLADLKLGVPETDALTFIRGYIVDAQVPQDKGERVLSPAFDQPENFKNVLQTLATLPWPVHFLNAKNLLNAWLPRYLAKGDLANVATDLDGIFDALVALAASGAHPIDAAQLRQFALVIIDAKAAVLSASLRIHWQIDIPAEAVVTTTAKDSNSGQSTSQDQQQEDHKEGIWEVIQATEAYQKMQGLLADVGKFGLAKLTPKKFMSELFTAAGTLDASLLLHFFSDITRDYFGKLNDFSAAQNHKNSFGLHVIVGRVLQQLLAGYEALLRKHADFQELKDFQRAHLLALLVDNLGLVEKKYAQTYIGISSSMMGTEAKYLPADLRVGSDGFTPSEAALYSLADDLNIMDIIWLFKQSAAAAISFEKSQMKRVLRIVFRRLAKLADKPKAFWSTCELFTAAGMDISKLVKNHQEQAAGFMHALAKNLDGHQKQGKLLEALRILSDGVRDPYVARQLAAFELERFWEEKPEFAARAAHFLDEKQSGQLDYQNRLIEVAATADDFTILHERLRGRLNGVAEQGSLVLGGLIVSELLNPMGKTAIEQIRLLMGSRHSDSEIKTALAGNWHSIANLNSVSQEAGIGSSFKENIRAEEHHLLQQMQLSERILNALLTLSKEARIYLVKRLLVDSDVMRDPQKRQEVLEILLKEAVDANFADPVYAGLVAVVQALKGVANWQELFFAITPILSEQIALPPKKPTPWESLPIYSIYRSTYLLHSNESDSDQPFKTPKRIQASAWWQREQQDTIAAEKVSRKWLGEQGLWHEPATERLSPGQMVKSIAVSGGALFVRLLQLLPQILPDLPEAFETSISDIYDSLRGQSKLAAEETILGDFPEFWNVAAKLGERLGGGSLMTVYDVLMKDGSEFVARVVNPNVLHRVSETAEILRALVRALKDHGDLSDIDAANMQDAIGMVCEWINEEMDLSGFLVSDAEFTKNVTRRDELTGYGVIVPEVYPREFARIQLERKIEGKNLTQWQALQDDGHDMAAVAGTLARSLLTQIQTGLVQGDWHAGNFRLTADKNIAILDRTHKLRLNTQDQEFLTKIFSGTLDEAAAMTYLVNFLAPEAMANLPELLASLSQMPAALAAGDMRQVNRLLLSARRLGLKIPLKLTLLLRGYDTLDRWARKAGLDGFAGALTYVPN